MIQGVFVLGDNPDETKLFKIADLSLGSLWFVMPCRDANPVAKNTILHLNKIKGKLSIVFEQLVKLNVR